MNRVSFYINKTGDSNGYSIFGHRLKQSLISKGNTWNSVLPDVSFIFVLGFFRPVTTNILRLDGLYFDTENTLGNSDRLNSPLFKAYRKADAIIFQSDFDHQLFKHFSGEVNKPHAVIMNGVPDSFSPEGDKVDYGFKKSLLCCAHWRAHKRLDCIIKGFLEYGEPDTGLIIIGEGIQKCIDHPNIQYINKMPPDELPRHLRGGNAFIHLSWLDHCPNTVVEAIACGLPVLCSHNGGTKEIVQSNGIVIQCEEDYDFRKVPLYKPPQCDPAVVAKGIEQILQWNKPVDPGYLSIDHVADEYMKCYENITH